MEADMKKFLVLMLFISLFFLVSCGKGNKNNDYETDSDDTATGIDRDTVDTDTAENTESLYDAEPDDSTEHNENTETDDNDNTGSDEYTQPDENTESNDCDSDGETVSEPVFVKQPAKMNVAPKGQSITLACEVKAEGYDVKYQWYESADGSTDAGVVP